MSQTGTLIQTRTPTQIQIRLNQTRMMKKDSMLQIWGTLIQIHSLHPLLLPVGLDPQLRPNVNPLHPPPPNPLHPLRHPNSLNERNRPGLLGRTTTRLHT